MQDENIRLTRLKNSSREMIYFISRDDFFYPIGRIRAMQVRLFSYFLEKDDAQEYPDDDANQNQKPVHEACARFRFFMQVLGYIVLEEQIDGNSTNILFS